MKGNSIKSPLDEGIIPVMLTVLMTVMVSLGVGWFLELNLVLSLMIGLLIWFAVFSLWMKIFLDLANYNYAVSNDNVVRYEIQVCLLEQRKTGYHERFPFVLKLKPLELYNLVNHLANGKGISHASLTQIGLKRDQITEIQEKFYAEGLIDTRGVDNSNGYDLTPFGKQLIKTWATYPSPTHDPTGEFWKQV